MCCHQALATSHIESWEEDSLGTVGIFASLFGFLEGIRSLTCKAVVGNVSGLFCDPSAHTNLIFTYTYITLMHIHACTHIHAHMHARIHTRIHTQC